MGIRVESILAGTFKDRYLIQQRILAELVRTGQVSIYIKRTKGLGDVLMALLVVEALRRKLPSNLFKVYFVTDPIYKDFLLRLRITELVITEAEVTGPFFVSFQDVVDSYPLCKEKHRLDLMANLVGLSSSDVRSDFRIKLHNRWHAWTTRLLHKFESKMKIVLAPWASTKTRCWPKWEDFLRLLLVNGYTVILMHNKRVEVPDHYNLINLTGRIRLVRVFSVLAKCDAAVVVDSGILHACGFLGVPFVGLFGSIDPRLRVAYYQKNVTLFLKASCPICPCWDWQEGTCKQTSFYLQCMQSITPAMVLETLKKLLFAEGRANYEVRGCS